MERIDRRSDADEWRNGWRALVGGAAAVSTGGSLFTYTASYFVKPMEAALGWTRSEIAVGMTIAMVVSASMMPVSGMLTDRFGTRAMGAVSLFLYALFCLTLALIPPQLGFYYAAIVGVSVLHACTNSVVFAPLIVSRFEKRRGIALAIMMSGPAMLLVPAAPVLAFIVNDLGWRAGYGSLAVIAFFIGVPGALLATSGPARTPADRSGSPAADPRGKALADALRSLSYWKIVLGVIACATPLGGFLHQMSALLSDHGMSVAEVGALGSVFVAMVIVGRTGIGLLLDVFHPPLVALGAMLCAASGSLLFLFAEPSFVVYAAVVGVMGASLGAVGDIEAFFVARQFGRKAYGAIFGTIAMCTAASIGMGASLFARMHDMNDRYDEAFQVAAVMFVVAGLMFATLPSRGRPIGVDVEPEPRAAKA